MMRCSISARVISGFNLRCFCTTKSFEINSITNLANNNNQYAAYLKDVLLDNINKVEVSSTNELEVFCSSANIPLVLKFLKQHTNAQFEQLMDITAVDYPKRENRFDIVYNLLSIRYNARIRVICEANEYDLVPSVTHIYKSANWPEREVFDMFGVAFSNHPDLRRILTDYGFKGHPLRKDFPLSGFTEVRYDDELGQVVQEPVELSQEMRKFDTSSPWDHFAEIKKELSSPIKSYIPPSLDKISENS